MKRDHGHPLRETAKRADAARDWLTVAFQPASGDWLPCSAVDAEVVAEWEQRAAEVCVKYDGRSHPVTSASYALGWYADIAAGLGALCFQVDRRVPHLDRAAVAFRRHRDDHYPDGVALLDPRFWCLPDDPDATHPDATVVPDEEALAARLRAEVRSHADEFLSWYRPGARLPRRDLLGAFYDGLDVGFWLDGAEASPADLEEAVAAARLALPGRTGEFSQGSSLEVVTDGSVCRLARLRVSCCNYYRVSDVGEECASCPRTSEADRLRRVLEPVD